MTYYFFIGLAHQSADNGSIGEAIKVYDKITTDYDRLKEDNSDLFFLTYYFRGLALVKVGSYELALESLNTALPFSAISVELLIAVLTNKSELLLQLKNYQGAEECNKEIVRLFDNSLQSTHKIADNITLNNKGVALFNLGVS
jgi:tetratricopeptide (TPR) repeat protein